MRVCVNRDAPESPASSPRLALLYLRLKRLAPRLPSAAHFLLLPSFLRALTLSRPFDDEPSRRAVNRVSGAMFFRVSPTVPVRLRRPRLCLAIFDRIMLNLSPAPSRSFEIAATSLSRLTRRRLMIYTAEIPTSMIPVADICRASCL